MELWIRSQDKERLMKANQLGIFELNSDVDPRYNCFGVYVDDYLVGEYKTKERALEVLDEIQRKIHPTILLSGKVDTNDLSWIEQGIEMQKYNDNFEIQQLSTYVYEMPKK